MNLTNATRYPAAYTMGMEPSGRELLVVVVKATFTIPQEGANPLPAEEQVPLIPADLFEGEPGLSAPLHESDFAPRKPRCDVVLRGSAHAPGGKPAETVPVLLQVGAMSKSFNVVGQRAWVKDVFGWTSTHPLPFVKMPISYGRAFGGRDVSDPDEKNHRWYGLNHAGVGFHSNLLNTVVEGKLLPNTEEIGNPVKQPDGKYRPMALGPIARAWEPRFRLAGTYDEKWLNEVCPFLPKDFQEEYYQMAPPDQQIPTPSGTEEVTLLNLTPAGRASFHLPRLDVPVTYFRRKAPEHEARAVVDAIQIEPDQARFTLTGRAALPLKRNLFEVAEILVGRRSRGWHRARELGKLYAPSLAHVLKRPVSGKVPP